MYSNHLLQILLVSQLFIKLVKKLPISMKISVLLLVLFTCSVSYAQYTGATPWENCYGKNASCEYVGCSDIKIITSPGSPIVAIVKKQERVIKHAYIAANDSYTFQIPDGSYQVFFYYGSKWDKNKPMSSKDCNNILGRFSTSESVTKTNIITLKGQIMTYTLSYSNSGNFSPKSSSLQEAL